MQLLKIRYFQIKNDLSYWVFVFSIVAFFVTKEIANSSATNALIFSGIVWLIIYGNYKSRKDLNFLSKYFVNYKLQIVMNHFILLLPITIGFLFTTNWYYIIFLHLLVSATVFVNFKTKQPKLLALCKMFSTSQFEWISGLRKHFALLLVFLVLAILLSPVKLFGIVPLFVFNTILFSFYNQSEPLLMLNPNWFSSEEFLSRKVRLVTKSQLLFNFPILAINSFFNTEVVWLNLAILLAFILIGACSIYIKYSYYQPNQHYSYKIDFLFLYASIFLPYFLPLSVFTYYSSKRKANTNLSNYLE